MLDSKGGVFFRQTRVGKDQVRFRIYKFRTMRPESEKAGQLTVGEKDPRVTPAGVFLRKYKLDELPQILNILFGDMSFVGPRPEVPKYIAYYPQEAMVIFDVRPGLTDFASLAFIDEDAQLKEAIDPEIHYIQSILPQKLALQRKYVLERTFINDLKIMWRTVVAILP